MDKLLSTVQKGGEYVREYIERFHNLSLICSTGMSLPMLLQTCRHNFLNRVEIRMGAIKAHTWKELVEQAEIAEKSAKEFELSVPKNKWEISTKGRDVDQSSQSKGKETMIVEFSGEALPKQKRSSANNNQEFKFPPR